MKVYISGYRPYYSLYIANYNEENNHPWINKAIDAWNDFVCERTSINEWFTKIVNFGPNRIKYVKIDHSDVWNLDTTLSLIIEPALKLLKERKHGAPAVDDEDVPDHLKSTSAPPKKDEYDVDELFFDRWNYVMDEMIFAFECLNTDWENQFHSGNVDWNFVPIDKDGNEVEPGSSKLSKIEYGVNHTHVFDHEGHEAMLNRIKNGLRLFSKYYMALWD